ncbi:hypothetical protein TUM4438_20370 [Shewanella sairae]|uniref:Uncharacterized protein n=1 Tax=Shewanella sairae TaxID=190310 RepID=A0ABQ4PED7_9GAMM|nr:DUF6445 family protein [Shewanella sairae]MCL1128666.1 DUF6445 family protein [Shewanella sairae]GIU45876.1 hypothetical protein TUM4438_20370 [Shewanella sairae]
MFKLNENSLVSVISPECNSCQVTIIDNALSSPNAVTQYAKETAYFNDVGADNTFYPGVRDKMPQPYLRFLTSLIEGLIIKGALKGDVNTLDVFRSELSLTTLAPNELNLYQKMPHIDCLNNDEYAVVHYFCSEAHGGTSLYNFKPLDLVALTKEHQVKQMIEQVAAQPSNHQSYIDGDTPLFQRVAQIPAKFNRIAIYKGNLLHSADLSNPINQVNDLDDGRLTVASFFYLAS